MVKRTKESLDSFDSILSAAISRPDERFYFYHALLELELVILGTVDGDQTETTDEESTIYLKYLDIDGELVLPVYLSMDKFVTIFPDNQPYLRMSAQRLIQLLEPDASLIVNPGFDISKKIIPEEIETLRDRRILSYFFDQLSPEKKQRYLESQMKPLSVSTKNILIELLKRFPMVRSAYLTNLFDPVTDDQPYVLVGLELESRDEKMDRVILIQLFDAIRQNSAID